jgi:hypothetical protein
LAFKWGGSLDQRELQSTTIHVRNAYDVTRKPMKNSIVDFAENGGELPLFRVKLFEIAGYLSSALCMGLPGFRLVEFLVNARIAVTFGIGA